MTEYRPSSAGRRLALIITELEAGGAERTLVKLATGIDRRRFSPVVYSLWDRPASGSDLLVTQLEAAGIPVRFVGLRRPTQLLRGSRRLRRLLAEQQPELVQCFLFHANVLGTWAARQIGTAPIALGVRVADPSPWRAMIERLAARRADRIVCVSQSVAHHVQIQGRFPAEKLTVIPNGLDCPAWDLAAAQPLTQPMDLTSGSPVLAVVGRLHPQKGLDWLLRVLPRIVAEFPQARLLLIGQGSQAGDLRAQTESLGLTRHVEFLGWRPDIPAILRRVSLLVLPSRWEGMPNAVLEAMAASLPVVATPAEGVAELLGDSPAQLVPFGDDERLAAAIASILRDPVLAQDLGRRNRCRVEADFSTAGMIAAYETLYAGMLPSC